jgi:hypothetical protein
MIGKQSAKLRAIDAGKSRMYIVGFTGFKPETFDGHRHVPPPRRISRNVLHQIFYSLRCGNAQVRRPLPVDTSERICGQFNVQKYDFGFELSAVVTASNAVPTNMISQP